MVKFMCGILLSLSLFGCARKEENMGPAVLIYKNGSIATCDTLVRHYADFSAVVYYTCRQKDGEFQSYSRDIATVKLLRH